jgi:hypothetical protein
MGKMRNTDEVTVTVKSLKGRNHLGNADFTGNRR